MHVPTIKQESGNHNSFPGSTDVYEYSTCKNILQVLRENPVMELQMQPGYSDINAPICLISTIRSSCVMPNGASQFHHGLCTLNYRIIDEDVLDRCCVSLEEWLSSAQDGDEIELNPGSCRYLNYIGDKYMHPCLQRKL